jgi:hypothetical protein
VENDRASEPPQNVAESALTGGDQPSAAVRSESCELAPDKRALESCLAGSPISAAGELAEVPSAPFSTTAALGACATYTGSCTGINGCSRAVGGGWEFTVCGTFIYAWMTICDGQPTGWGNGICLF